MPSEKVFQKLDARVDLKLTSNDCFLTLFSVTAQVKLSGPGLGPVVASNEPAELTVDARSLAAAAPSSAHAVQVRVTDAEGRPVAAEVTETEVPGLFRCVYTPIKLQTHTVYVSYGLQAVSPSPFRVCRSF